MYLLGYDIGSSSIKAALVDAQSGRTLGVIHAPEGEMEMRSEQPGWAEQDPEKWWHYLCMATRKLLKQTDASPSQIEAIGIAYQMHGLVLVDKELNVLRPSIIWCDSRAVPTGDEAFQQLGEQLCLSHFLNSPGNFTASKLKWVKTHEPKTYEQTYKMMLPGDYLAMKMSGEVNTTISGLSEGILWDFANDSPAHMLLEHYGLNTELLPELVPTFSRQGQLTPQAALETGLMPGIPITYRAGDQPNNALSLNVLEPGEVAATGGTSGVVYGIVDQPLYDPASRVNGFAHVNHQFTDPRIGILLCINGAGIQYRWIKQQMAGEALSYPEMEQLAASVPIGSEGLRILPFGNGAERMLSNTAPGAHIVNLQFNRHSQRHVFRAALEGIAFSFTYGMKILMEMGLDVQVMRVGNDNLFQSAIFSQTLSNLMKTRIEVIQTTGAVGAAKAAGVGAGRYGSVREAVQDTQLVTVHEPDGQEALVEQAYHSWFQDLQKLT